jgi:small subunit ribosomal protein S17
METEVTNPKTLMGTVVASKMKDTITVAVTRYVKHPKYKKYIMKTKKYLAHNPGNTKAVGERVTIRSCRPISKNKHFMVV